MFLQKISSSALIFSLIFSLLFGVIYSIALPTHALVMESSGQATVAENQLQCPVDGFVTAEFSVDEVVIESEFISEITLSNNTEYVLNGINVAVAVYQNEDQAIPSHWMVLDETFSLSAGQQTSVPVEVDASFLQAGNYVFKTVVMQGNTVSLLGAAIRGGDTDSVNVQKRAIQEKAVSVDVEVNNQSSNGETVVLAESENIVVSIVTQNNADVPIVNTEMVAVINQGQIPLGAAVRESEIDSIKLVPTGTRTTQVVDVFPEGGDYSVYAGLSSATAFLPIKNVPVQIGEVLEGRSWAYLSKVASTDEQLTVDTEIIGCLNYVGANEELVGVFETLEMQAEVMVDGELITEVGKKTNTAGASYISVKPEVNAVDAVVITSLHQERFPSIAGEEGQELSEIDGDTEVFLTNVQEVEFELSCGSSECVSETEDVQPVKNGEGASQSGNSFYFYAAIVIAAALLLYIMLRRLHPEEPLSTESNSTELE